MITGLLGSSGFRDFGVLLRMPDSLVIYEVQVRLVPFYLKENSNDPVKSIDIGLTIEL